MRQAAAIVVVAAALPAPSVAAQAPTSMFLVQFIDAHDH
jgi:hypothetical protein